MRTVLAAVAAVLVSASAAWAADDCHVGAYRFANGDVVDIGQADEGTLRWKMFDGAVGTLHPKDCGWTSTFGWTGRPDGHHDVLADCARSELTFDGKTAQRIAIDVSDTPFAGLDGEKLRGLLVLPKGADKVAVVVLV